MKFFRSFQNSILLIVIVTIATLCISLFFAAVLTREKIRGANFFRVVFYISNILSIVVIAGIFSAIYDPESGLLNSILDRKSTRLNSSHVAISYAVFCL